MPVICWDFMGNLPFTGNLQEVSGLLYPTSTKILSPFRGHAMKRQKVWEGVNNIYILPDLPSTNSVIFGFTTWHLPRVMFAWAKPVFQEYRRQSASDWLTAQLWRVLRHRSMCVVRDDSEHQRSVCEEGKEVEKSSCRDSASLKANAAPVVEISLMGERWQMRPHFM